MGLKSKNGTSGDTFLYLLYEHLFCLFVFKYPMLIFFLNYLLELLWEGLGKEAAFRTLFQWEIVCQIPIKWPANKLLEASTFTMSCSTFGLYLLASSFKEKSFQTHMDLWFLNMFLDVSNSLLMENHDFVFLKNGIGKSIGLAT